MIDRLVKRTVLVAAVLAGLAFLHNHTTAPCDPHPGVGGLCVTVAAPEGLTR